MEFITQLWMPILLSALFVWIASSIAHMFLPHHKSEYNGLPDEAKFNSALEGVPPGQYMFPWGTMAEMGSPEYKAKVAKGPNGTLHIWPGGVNMGRNMVLTILSYIVISLFVAYVAHHSLDPGVTYLTVFRVTGAAAFLAYGLGWIPHMIWYGEKGFWANIFDALLYSLLVGGTFGWLWPK